MVCALQGTDLTSRFAFRTVCTIKKPRAKPGVLVSPKCALAAMTAMINRSNRLQIEPRHCRHDVEAGLALNAHRLESERVIESADKAVGSDANADRRPAGNAGITAGQRARANARSAASTIQPKATSLVKPICAP